MLDAAAIRRLTLYLQGLSLTIFPCSPFTLTVRQFSFGQSNPTYLCTVKCDYQTLSSTTLSPPLRCKFVLRRKPNHAIDKTAHAIDREYHVLRYLKARDPRIPVPMPYHLCSDIGVIGVPFFVMEFVEGRIFKDPALKSVPASERRSYYEEAVRVVHMIHSVPVDEGDDVFSTPGKSSFKPRKKVPFIVRQMKKLLSVR